jgi:predicted RND superfamily exporter protein
MLNSDNPKNNPAARIGKWTIKWRWLVVLGSLLVATGFGYGGQFLGFNSDYRVFFSDENPQLSAFDALQDKYTKDDNILVVVEPQDGDVFTPETLSAIEELTKESWQTPFSSRVDAITNYQHTRAVEDDLYVDDLIEDALSKSPQEIAEIKRIAINEHLLRNRLVDENGTITAINITLKFAGDDPLEQDSVLLFVQNMLHDFEATHPDLKTYTSGITPLSGAFKEAAEKDMGTLMPLMFLIIILAIWMATRSLSSTAATLVIIILSIMTGMGFAGWAGLELTAPSSAAMTIIMTLAIADSVHILITMLQQMRVGKTKREAIVESVRVNFTPVFITSLTTVIGFLTMNFSDSPPFHDLGNITAVGMTAAFIFSIITLPALMAILPIHIKEKSAAASNKSSLLERYGNWVVLHNRRVTIVSFIVVIAVSIFSVTNELNDEFVKYFGKDITFRTDTDHISQKLTGIYNTEFSLNSGESGGISNPEYLKDLEGFTHWLEDQPEVVHVNTFSEVSKRVNKSMHGDDEAYFKVPDSREEAAQYLLLYEMSLPFGLDLNNQINVDKSESRLTVTVENVSSNQLVAFNARAENWLRQNAPEYMFTHATSTSTMFAHLGGRQMRSMMIGTAFALFLITLVLMLVLKSANYGLASLFPNITPVAMGFGVWALLYGQVNTGISIVFGMTLGIIVDDTVHFVSKYLRARREDGKSPEDAVRYAFTTVGQALVVTTIVLVAGFFVLGQSQFAMNNGMARLTVIIMGLALAIDFTILPGLLIYMGRREDAKANNIEKQASDAIGIEHEQVRA